MAGLEALRRVAKEIEARAQRFVDEDVLHARLIRDLARARLYLRAVQSGYAHLIPDRLYRELLDRYRTDSTTDGPPPEDE